MLSTFLGFEGVPGALAVPGELVAGARVGAVLPVAGAGGAGAGPGGALRGRGGGARRVRCPSSTDIDLTAARTVVDVGAGRRSRPADCWTRSHRRAAGTAVASRRPADAARTASRCSCRCVDDRSFGALVSFGLAGLATDLLGDRAYAAVPLTDSDAAELIEAPRAAPLLHGYGGGPPGGPGCAGRPGAAAVGAGRRAARDRRVARWTVTAGRHGAHVTSARVRVAPPTARADTGPRRLRGL